MLKKIKLFLLLSIVAASVLPFPVYCDTPLILSTLHNPPLEYKTDTRVTGALVDIVTETAKRTGKRVKILIRPWKRAQKEVETGEAHGCFNTGKTSLRETWAYFHDTPLFNETYVLFALKGTHIPIAADMGNAGDFSVGIQRGYAYGGPFQAALDGHRFKAVQEVETIEQNIKKLRFKRIDFFVGDRIPVRYYLGQKKLNQQVEILKNETGQEEMTISVWPTYVAFSQKRVHPEYVKRFNAALIQVKADGTYKKIFQTYLQ